VHQRATSRIGEATDGLLGVNLVSVGIGVFRMWIYVSSLVMEA